jgi:uncharacterized protein (TIGR02231 family)
MKKLTMLLLPLIALIVSAPAFTVNQQEITGKISKVTVYHGQAMVTRQITVELPQGSSEVLVTGLPQRIIPESIYAESSGDTKVLSVRYRTKAVEADTREEVKKLDAEIDQLKRQIYHYERQKGHLDNQWSMFIKLRDFTVDATKSDTSRGILSYEPVYKLVEFIQAKGQEYIDQTLSFEDKIADLKNELELLGRKRNELAAERTKSQREAILYLNKAGKGKSTVELNYLVNDADWLPQYNLRGDTDKANVLIEYNAVINQTSGEDWDSVALSLSTAEPAMIASAPTLEALNIALRPQFVQQPEQAVITSGMLQQQDFKGLIQQRIEVAREGKAGELRLRKIAADNQTWELNTSRGQIVRMKEEIEAIRRIEGISVTYELPGRITLPSRSDQQLATIATVNTKADFTFIATPLLTDYVYLQADLLNDSDIIFLPGQASVFRNGQFVGKSQMPVVTIGEKLTTGFGIDSQIRVTREIEDKQTNFQGGNRIDTFEYRIALENYKNSLVRLKLIDRLPYTDDKSIKIELTENSRPLSDDSEYVRKDKKKGLLRWDIELAPNTVDDKAAAVTYSYIAEYDRNMQIQPVGQNQ